MCCFTRPVERVEETRIYARAEGSRQLVVYELRLAADGDLAMVLPIPVAAASGERAVTFVDLSSSPTFFRGLEFAFREEDLGAVPRARVAPQAKANLVVHQVGAFEASFVPQAEDFDRLDPRFSLPSSLWHQIPSVRGFGFVVFKLRRDGAPAPRGILDRVLGKPVRAASVQFHPMAFWFPRADLSRVFFPTLHVHDGQVHASADFDHVLYAQAEQAPAGWDVSPFALVDGVGGAGRALVLPRVGQRYVMRGTFANVDQWIGA